MFTITGFDKLSKELESAQKALSSLDGKITDIAYDPNDINSVNMAIRKIEDAIDKKILPFKNNSFVQNLAKEMKAAYAKQIRSKKVINKV